MQVSFVIRDAEEKRHRNGVNALQLDQNNGRLYSAGKRHRFVLNFCFFVWFLLLCGFKSVCFIYYSKGGMRLFEFGIRIKLATKIHIFKVWNTITIGLTISFCAVAVEIVSTKHIVAIVFESNSNFVVVIVQFSNQRELWYYC